MKFDQCIMIGCGGTGSHLLEPLSLLLSYHENGCDSITIVDGDRYEDDNKTRQLFDPNQVNENKARAMAARFSHLNLEAVPSYMGREAFQSWISQFSQDQNILVVPCVDNLKTRHEILEVLTQRRNVVYLSPGNNLSDGSTVLYVKQNGVERQVHPFERYQNLRNPDDFIPGGGGLGCAEKAVSTPQLITANKLAATMSLNLVQNLLDGKPVPEAIVFDLYRVKYKSFGNLQNMDEDIPEGLPEIEESLEEEDSFSISFESF